MFWQHEVNVNVSSIMRFEDLLELWQQRCAQQPILEFLGIRSRGSVRGDEENGPGFVHMLHERLDGTWWEVTVARLPGRSVEGGIRCRYVADSLKDAVRRCPGAQFPPEASIDDEDGAPEEESDTSCSQESVPSSVHGHTKRRAGTRRLPVQ